MRSVRTWSHALVWLDAGSKKLGRTARRRIDAAASVGISVLTTFEVGLLVERGRLRLRDDLVSWRRDLAADR